MPPGFPGRQLQQSEVGHQWRHYKAFCGYEAVNRLVCWLPVFLGSKGSRTVKSVLEKLKTSNQPPASSQGFVGSGLTDVISSHYHNNCQKLHMFKFTCNLKGPLFFLGDGDREIMESYVASVKSLWSQNNLRIPFSMC
jgi:hypothetical protein